MSQLRTLTGFSIALAALTVTACGSKYPNCDNDDDCHEGEFCVDGQCQLCRDSSDCQPGEACNGGRCDPIPGYCADDGDCPDGQRCVGSRCSAPAQADEGLPETPSDRGCQYEAVLFGFDADALDQAARNSVEANVRCMNERQATGVQLTGHCDPRGTEEYNLALGDRRARGVMQYMVSLGVSASNINASSMGEEMARGTDESSWARDRRVEFSGR